MKFRNPANGHVEDKSAPWLWSLLFGGFYLIASGLWAPFVIWLILAIVFYSSMGAPGTMFVFFMNIVYALMAGGMVRSSYLRKGWVELAAEPVNDGAARAPIPPAPLAPGMRKCPFCAEEIKVEAIKCKHCGSEVPAADAA